LKNDREGIISTPIVEGLMEMIKDWTGQNEEGNIRYCGTSLRKC